MTGMATLERWRQRLRARRASAEPDAADHGTTFGLEMSLAAGVPAVTRPARDGSTRHWWQRFGARRAAPGR